MRSSIKYFFVVLLKHLSNAWYLIEAFLFVGIRYTLLSFLMAKIMQMSAMKARFQIAECSLSSAKIHNLCEICAQNADFFAFLWEIILSSLIKRIKIIIFCFPVQISCLGKS